MNNRIGPVVKHVWNVSKHHGLHHVGFFVINVLPSLRLVLLKISMLKTFNSWRPIKGQLTNKKSNTTVVPPPITSLDLWFGICARIISSNRSILNVLFQNDNFKTSKGQLERRELELERRKFERQRPKDRHDRFRNEIWIAGIGRRWRWRRQSWGRPQRKWFWYARPEVVVRKMEARHRRLESIIWPNDSRQSLKTIKRKLENDTFGQC